MVVAIGLALAMTLTVAAQDRPERYAEVARLVERAIERGESPSVAVAVVEGGEPAWAEGFGVADPATGAAATAETPYSLASVTKPITATGLMVLVDRGKLDLDAPANASFEGGPLRVLGDDRPDAADAITIRRLASHTAGLPTHWSFYYDGREPPSPLATARTYGFAYREPGTAWEYSNLGFGLLGFATEAAAGEPWAAFLDREVFRPLGMAHTVADGGPGPGAAARCTRDLAGRFVAVPIYRFDHPGASSAWSSAADLARFARMHLADGAIGEARVLSVESARAMRVLAGERSPGEGTGIGWGLGRARGRRTAEHTGGMPGVSTLLRLYPDDRSAIVVLANAEAGGLVGRVAGQIDRVLFEGDGPGEAHPRSDRLAPTTPEPDGSDPPAFDWAGTWSGTVRLPEGDLPIRLVIDAEGTGTFAIGDARPRPLADARLDGGALAATLPGGPLFVQPSFHGQPALSLRLAPRGPRLVGLLVAESPRYFHLPHGVVLDRE